MEYLKEITEKELDEIYYLKLLRKAINNINEDSVVVENGTIDERNYVSVLREELRCQFCQFYKNKKTNISSISCMKYFISGENGKTIEPLEIENIQKKLRIKKYIVPDLLIHASHKREESLNVPEGQYLVLEAKTKSFYTKSFLVDFFKLNYYIEKLKFKIGVYLIIGKEKKYINKYLQEYFDEISFQAKNSSNIFFFIKEHIDAEFKLYRFCQNNTQLS